MKKRKLNFYLFDINTNVSTAAGMSPEMKTFYDRALLRCAEPNLIYDQFGQKRDIPKNNGKIIEFRKFSSLPKALTPLTEGVTPDGQSYSVTAITATVSQYGAYIAIADVLQLTAFDEQNKEIIQMLGSQAGRTGDTITREVVCAGTNVRYANSKTSRANITSADRLTVADIKKGINDLKNANASKIRGDWICLLHPDTVYDLTNDTEWVEAARHAGSDRIWNGEIGRFWGTRFIESTEAKIWKGEALTAGASTLTVKTTLTQAGKAIAVNEAISSSEAAALANKDVYINGTSHRIASATAGAAGSASITTTDNVTVTDGASGNVISATGAGADGSSVYATILLGDNAYGVTKVNGAGLETIAKPLGSAGTADPLNQRATFGWKMMKTAKILAEEYMVRLEHGATLAHGAN